jgi:hypothetical protein
LEELGESAEFSYHFGGDFFAFAEWKSVVLALTSALFILIAKSSLELFS